MKKVFILFLIQLTLFASHFRDGIRYYKQKKYEEAFREFRVSVDKEKIKSSYYFLGVLYLKGLGTPQDLKKAEKYLKYALSFGNARANCFLAEILLMKKKEIKKAKKMLLDGKKSGAYECEEIAKNYKIDL